MIKDVASMPPATWAKYWKGAMTFLDWLCDPKSQVPSSHFPGARLVPLHPPANIFSGLWTALSHASFQLMDTLTQNGVTIFA